MKQLLAALFLFVLPVTAHAIPTGIYDLTGESLAGSFRYDATQSNPFVDWQFQYIYPTAGTTIGYTADDLVIVRTDPSPIFGQTWMTDDGGSFYARSQTFNTANSSNLSLAFQLCYTICSDTQDAYGARIYDPISQLTYSAGGEFTLRSEPLIEQGQASPASVPEPQIWMLLGGVVLGLLAVHRFSTNRKSLTDARYMP